MVIVSHKVCSYCIDRVMPEDQYAEMFRVPMVPPYWLPLPESVSLEQPSPYLAVPSICSNSTGEERWMLN